MSDDDDDFPQTYEEAKKTAYLEFSFGQGKMSTFGLDFEDARSQPCAGEGQWCLAGRWQANGTRRVVYCNASNQCSRGVLFRRGDPIPDQHG